MMHRDADVEDSVSMQRQSMMESLQVVLIVWPLMENKVTLQRCTHAERTLGPLDHQQMIKKKNLASNYISLH